MTTYNDNKNEDSELIVNEAVDPQTLSVISQAEIDTQIATAKKYPRSIKQFLDDATTLVSLNEHTANECRYRLKRTDRDGNRIDIVGPSSRFAELMAHSWGNCRAAARILEEKERFVTAQGAFIDLEKNVAITVDVQMPIVTKYGHKYSTDMIGVTCMAACSKALRNAVLKGVPKAIWFPIFQRAQQVAMGDAKTLSKRRDDMVKAFEGIGVTKQEIFALLEVKGIQDIDLEKLDELSGVWIAIRDRMTTADQIFRPNQKSNGRSSLNDSIKPPGGDANASEPPRDETTAAAEKTPTEDELRAEEQAMYEADEKGGE